MATAATLEFVRLSEVAAEIAPRCIVCAHRTTMACTCCSEPICGACADEQNWFDGEDIICEGCADDFMARVYRDSLAEAKGA
jgi:hypothetical protein